MGDRSNIVMNYGRFGMEDSDRMVYFYAHFGGADLAATLQEALEIAKKANRLADPGYLSRIVFCRMLGDGPEVNSETTAYGIDVVMGDNEYPLLIVNIPAQRVELTSSDGPIIRMWTFKEYLDEDPERLVAVMRNGR